VYQFSLFLALFTFIYEDSDSLIVYNDSLTMAGHHAYNHKVHLSNAAITISPWSGVADTTGWLILDAPEITCDCNSSFLGSGQGYWGGSSGHGDGYGPGAGGEGGISGGGGGGAGYGGAGGDGGDYYPGSGGSTYGVQGDTVIEMGSGGGAGQYISTIDGFGGNGGAMVRLQGGLVILDSTDCLVAGDQGASGYIGFEGGGGGSGGGILILAYGIYIHHTNLLAHGGDGAGSEWGGGGGGGGGRIKIFYFDTLDTTGLACAATGGDGGTGYQGSDGEPGDDGTIHIEHLVGIRVQKKTLPSLTLLKTNPVGHSVILEYPDHPAMLKVHDINGRLLCTHTLVRRISTIPLNELPTGVYFLSIENRPVGVIKIIVVK
jgi:hypothetical protein